MGNRVYMVVLCDKFGHRASCLLNRESGPASVMSTVRMTLAEASMDSRGFHAVEPTFKGDLIQEFQLTEYPDVDGSDWGMYCNIYDSRGKLVHHELIDIC